jgi:hypothetical protein
MILSLLLISFAQQPIDAQGEFQLFASVSYETMLPQDNMCYANEVILFDSNDSWPRTYLPQSTFGTMLPDLDGDGLFDYPRGIDALSVHSRSSSDAHNYFSFVFSIDSNSVGYLDGDILCLDQNSGLRLVYSEQQLIDDLQITSGSLDVDAVCVLSADEVLISFRDGLQSTFLGAIEDGAIVSWNPQLATASIFATEADVQQWVANATSSSAANIGDLKSLSYDDYTQSIIFSVQSPSSLDAAVFTNQGQGSYYKGVTESSWQFRAPTELDALCIAPQQITQAPVLSISAPYVHSGDYVNIRLRHAIPGAVVSGAASSVYKVTMWPRVSVGFTALSKKASYYKKWPQIEEAPIVVDSSGTASYSFYVPQLPPGALQAVIYCQARVAGQGLSSPIKIQISG